MLMAAGVGGGAGADAAVTRPATSPGAPPVERVLVVTLPGVTWADVTSARVPRLRALLGQSAVASVSVHVFHSATSTAEGYATLGAGALMNSHRRLAAQARPAGDGHGIDSPAAPMLRALNRQRRRGAEVGSLGRALAAAGVGRAVVANADTAPSDDPAAWHREATLVLADGHGRVPAGEVGRSLLVADPAAPFGIRLDRPAVTTAVRAAWTGRSVVAVEASDVARAQLAADALPPARRRPLVAGALAATDALLGDLLAGVDERRTAVLVVTPSTVAGEAHLGMAALRAPGIVPGLLNSASTRRPGLVTLADVAPTVLELIGVPRPPDMEGRPFEVGRRGPVALAGFVQTDRESNFRDRMVAPATLAFVVVELALAVAGALVLAGRPGRRRARPVVAFAALWVLSMLPMSWLPASFDITAPAAWYALVVGGGLALAVAARALGRTPLVRLAVPLGVLFVLLVADVVTGAGFQLSAVFGYSATAGGRFAGFGNLAFAQVAAAATLLAAGVAHLLGGRRGAWAGVGVLGVVVVADGLPAWGADVGGVLSGLPGFAVVATGLLGVQLSVSWLLGVGGATVAAVAAFGGLDLLRPPGERTHLGRLLERMGDDGLAPLWDTLGRKAEVAWDLALPAARRWLPLIPAGLAFVAFVSLGRHAALRQLGTPIPQLGPAVAGILVAAALGFALNDSGVAIPAMMLGVLTPALVHLTLEG